MQNIAIIGAVAIVVIGGIWFVTSSDQPATNTATDTNPPETNTAANTGSVDSDSMNESEAGAPTMNDPMSDPDIVATAMDTNVLSTLVTAVSEAELVATLQSEGPFTVFAPTNDAFASLPDGTLDTLLLPKNQSQLQSILTYHVIPGMVMAGDLTDGMSVETVNGETLTITLTEDGAVINDSVTVTTTDIVTSNGVVHIIDGVLLP